MKWLADGVYAISDDFEFDGEGATNFVFCRGWLLEMIDLDSGEYCFDSNGSRVRSNSRRFGAYYPPFTLIRPYIDGAKGRVRGIGSTTFYDGLPGKPILFETDFEQEFTDISEALEVVRKCRNSQSIEVNSRPTALSVKTKQVIDENYLIYPSIAKIARRLGVSAEHLSRDFKRNYGLSPSSYLHQLRVAEATFKLAVGEEIIDISLDVGYNDLSRFYKQFRKTTHTSPAVCRTMLGGEK